MLTTTLAIPRSACRITAAPGRGSLWRIVRRRLRLLFVIAPLNRGRRATVLRLGKRLLEMNNRGHAIADISDRARRGRVDSVRRHILGEANSRV